MNILVALVRNRQLGRYIDAGFQPFRQPLAPLLCIVLKGEACSLAAPFGWGAGKLAFL
jgi:hypothetical protein